MFSASFTGVKLREYLQILSVPNGGKQIQENGLHCSNRFRNDTPHNYED